MDTIVRKARPDELRLIQDLNHKLFKWEFDRDPALNIQWPYEAGKLYFEKKISGENGVCFVAEIDSSIVGYVAGRVNKDIDPTDTIRRSELENIFVEADFQHQGVGKLLAKEFLSWCKENGAASTFVSAFFHNEEAVHFYTSVGFEPRYLKLEAKHHDD